jgi:hypothetical protein
MIFEKLLQAIVNSIDRSGVDATTRRLGSIAIPISTLPGDSWDAVLKSGLRDVPSLNRGQIDAARWSLADGRALHALRFDD